MLTCLIKCSSQFRVLFSLQQHTTKDIVALCLRPLLWKERTNLQLIGMVATSCLSLCRPSHRDVVASRVLDTRVSTTPQQTENKTKFFLEIKTKTKQNHFRNKARNKDTDRALRTGKTPNTGGIPIPDLTDLHQTEFVNYIRVRTSSCVRNFEEFHFVCMVYVYHINYPDSHHLQWGLKICHTNFTST